MGDSRLSDAGEQLPQPLGGQGTDRGLLLGLLALQNNFLDRAGLLSGLDRWKYREGAAQ